MTSTAARTEPPAAAPDIEWGMPSRIIASFSGTAGLVVKLALLALMNAVVVWAAIILAQQQKWIALVVVAAATVAIDLVYLSKRSVPLKFLIPGTVFLIVFQVIPIDGPRTFMITRSSNPSSINPCVGMMSR